MKLSRFEDLECWQETVRLGQDYRWSGSDLDIYAWAFPRYKRPLIGQELYDDTHNDYLQAFAEGGLSLVALLMANAILFVLLLALACRVLGLRGQQVCGVARSGVTYGHR